MTWVVPEVVPPEPTVLPVSERVRDREQRKPSLLSSVAWALFFLVLIAGASYAGYLGVAQPWLRHPHLLLLASLNTPCYPLRHNPGWYAC